MLILLNSFVDDAKNCDTLYMLVLVVKMRPHLCQFSVIRCESHEEEPKTESFVQCKRAFFKYASGLDYL